MVDRSVEVVLRARVSDFKKDINDAAVTTDRLDARLAAADGSLDQLGRTSKKTGKDVDGVGQSAKKAQTEVERLTAKLGQQTKALETERATLKGLRADLKSATGDTTDLTRVIGDQEKTVRRQEDSVTRLTAALRGYSTASSESGSVTRSLIDDNDALSASARRTESDLDKVSTRVKLYMQAAAVGGPALIPVGAAAAPGIASLVALLASGAAGALTLVAALQGVGDATKAIDAYQLDPTVENLQKARESLEALPKSAQAFVLAFQGFQPTLDGLQKASADGAMPGLIESLENAKTLAPQVEDFLGKVSRAAGEAAADSTASLASDRWREVFDYFTAEAPGKLTALTSIVGDLGHGLAQLVVSMDPGTDSATKWIGDVADGFDRWASSDKGREDVQAFMEYARQNGPEVEAFFVGLVDAGAQLVQAAAPLGGPTLTILTKVLDVFAGIADSDIGTPLLAGAAALSVYNRALAVTAKLQNSPLGQKTGMFGGVAADVATGQKTVSMVDKLKARTPAVRDFGNALAFAAFSNDTLTKSATSGSKVAATSATNALRARQAVAGWASDTAKAAAPFAKTAAAVAGLAVVSTGAADKIGLTNTASLALMGTMLGPYGAAIGATAGLVMDITAANDGWVASQEAVNASYELSTGAFTARASALRDMREEMVAQNVAEAKVANDVGKKGFTLDFKSSSRMIGGILGDNGEDTAREYLAAAAAAREADEAVAGLARSMGRSVGPIDGSARSAAELDAVLTAAQPAMDSLGISQQQLISAFGLAQGPIGGMADALAEVSGSEADSTFDKMTEGISSYLAQADSMAGRTRGVGDAIAGLDDELLSTADSAAELSTALDALLGPNLNLSQATDDWAGSLRNLGDDLSGTNKSLTGQTEAAEQNRTAIRKRVGELSNMLTLEAEAGAGPAKLARTLQTQKKALLDSAEAAGLGRKATARLIAQMGLTPKLVRTVFKAAEADRVANQAKTLKRTYDQLPKNVKSEIRLNGVPKTRSDANRIANQLDLTAKDRQTLLRLVDQASGKGKAVQALLKLIGGMNPRPSVTAQDRASGVIRGVIGLLNSIHDRSATITTYHRDVRQGVSAAKSAQQIANGGIFRGPVRTFAAGGTVGGGFGGGFDDDGRFFARIPQVVVGGRNIRWAEPETGREAYISDKPGLAERNLGILDESASWFGARVVRREELLQARVDDYTGRLQPSVDQFAGGGTAGRGRGGRGGGDGFALFGSRPGRGGGGGRPDPARAEVRAIVDRIAEKFDKALDRNAKALKGATGEKRKDLLEKREDILKDRWKASAEAIKKETQQRKDLTDKIASYKDEVTSAYRRDLFGNGLEGLNLQLEADENDARSMIAALNEAAAKGFDGALYDALAASGDLNTAQQISMLDRTAIDALEKRYASSMSATAAVGTLAADTRFGSQLDEQNRVIRQLSRALERFETNAGKNVRDGARSGSRDGARQGTARGNRDNDKATTRGRVAQGRGGGRRRKGR